MTSREERRLESFAETLKTLILTVLVISLISLTVVYIGGTHIYQTMTEDAEPKVFDKLWSTQSDYRSEGLDGARLSPELICYRLTGAEPRGVIASEESIAEVWELISPCLAELLGNGSVCSELEPSDGEHRFHAALASDEYIFVRFHEPTLYQLVYAYISGRATIEEDAAASMLGEGGAYLRELVILPESDVAAHRFVAFASDGEGNYYEFRLADEFVASDFYLSRLGGQGESATLLPVTFPGGSLSRTQPLVSGELDSVSLSSEKIDLTERELYEKLLPLLGFNPEKLRGYTSEGVGVYYNSDSRVRLEVGKLSYSAVDASGGLPIADLLGYSTVSTLSLYDKLIAVDNLLTGIEELSPQLTGGEARLCLGSVYTEGGLLVIEYIPTYDGMRIESAPTVRAKLAQDRLTSLELTAVAYAVEGASTLSPEQGYVIRKLTETGMIVPTTGCEMRFSIRDGTAMWSVTKGFEKESGNN